MYTPGSCLQAVSELQQQVADLKLEKEQLLKAVTEQQHDAACLAEQVAQIGQLKQVLANMQQHNAELETDSKVPILVRLITQLLPSQSTPPDTLLPAACPCVSAMVKTSGP